MIRFLLPVLAYLSGSVPFGILITRKFTSIDIRKHGSGNIGATNVRRIAGNLLGFLTLAGDILKGFVPVFIGARLVEGCGTKGEIYISLVAIVAFSGHLFPIYTKFKGGGKGVATALGCFLAISPWAVFVSLLVFILMVCITSIVSAGSLAGVMMLVFSTWIATKSKIFTICAAIIALSIFIRHHENIKRLVNGEEHKLGGE